MMAQPPLPGNNITKVKAHNQQVLLRILLQQEAVSRVRLAELTGLSTTTITNQITELVAQGVVSEDSRATSQHGIGRPRRMLRLNPTARYAIGIHIGIGQIRVAIADLFGQLHGLVAFASEPQAAPEQVLRQIARHINQVIAEVQIDRTCLVGVGVGASGLVDPQTGVNILAPNLGWHNVAIATRLSAEAGLPTLVDNNVRAMALAESMFGQGRGIGTLAFVYARVGVGAGFVIDGHLYRGTRAGAGEIGHTVIVPAGGILCQCGNTGCLETLISEPELVRQAQLFARRSPEAQLARCLAQTDAPTCEAIFEAARLGDADASALVEERAHYMGLALANLVNTLNPEMIVLGGLFVPGRDLFLPIIEETMRQRAFAGLGQDVSLCVTQFGNTVGAIGAAALALDHFFYKQEATVLAGATPL